MCVCINPGDLGDDVGNPTNLIAKKGSMGKWVEIRMGGRSSVVLDDRIALGREVVKLILMIDNLFAFRYFLTVSIELFRNQFE